ncbi:MAG TPA: hypothetical protein VMM78_01400 [Thermomicrobiales bacterium]|nr:hypothetical protein [Thermomicrobiales bacterium]
MDVRQANVAGRSLLDIDGNVVETVGNGAREHKREGDDASGVVDRHVEVHAVTVGRCHHDRFLTLINGIVVQATLPPSRDSMRYMEDTPAPDRPCRGPRGGYALSGSFIWRA